MSLEKIVKTDLKQEIAKFNYNDVELRDYCVIGSNWISNPKVER